MHFKMAHLCRFKFISLPFQVHNVFAANNFYTKNDIFTHLFQVQASDRVFLDFFSTGWEEFDNKEKIEDFWNCGLG